MGEPHLVTMASWAASLARRDIPDDVRRAARLQIASMIAAAHAGARWGESAPVLGGMRAMAGRGSATVVATGERVSAVDAALANAACSMAQDFDDIVWMGHTCHSAVFAALAIGEELGSSVDEVVDAVVIANELAGRIGASSFLGPLNGQMWTFIHLVGGAAAAARLLGLDGERTAHALAIALAQPTFALQPGFLAPTSKLLAASTPTGTGMQAAFFARAGMTGALAILEDRRGFWRRFSYLPLPAMLGGLGTFWTLRTLEVKTYPGCHYFQTACSAIETILARTGGLDASDVKSVLIETTKLGAEVAHFAGDYGDDIGPVSVSFDLRATAAVLLHARRLTAAEADPRRLAANQADLRRWRDKIAVRHAPDLTARVIAGGRGVAAGRKVLSSIGARDLLALRRKYGEDYGSSLLSARELVDWIKLAARRRARRSTPTTGNTEAIPLYFPNRVTIRLAGGGSEEEQVDLPVASVASPDVERLVAAKLAQCVTPGLGAARAVGLWDAILGGGSQSIRELTDLATPAPSAQATGIT
jgi:2-methylcitrate dehydratase PrpD